MRSLVKIVEETILFSQGNIKDEIWKTTNISPKMLLWEKSLPWESNKMYMCENNAIVRILCDHDKTSWSWENNIKNNAVDAILVAFASWPSLYI